MPKAKQPQTNIEKKVLVVSDLHAGSFYGLWPPDVVVNPGREAERSIDQTRGQAYLWACWLQLLDDMSKIRPDVVVVNGDVIDGKQQAQWGTEANSLVPADQREGAILILRALQKATNNVPMFFVQGTEYHDAKAGDEAEKVAETLGGTPAPEGIGTGKYSAEVLNLEFDGVVLNFSHGISVSGGLYRATSPDREGVWSALAGKSGKLPKADAVIRSHAHYFVHVEHESKHILITPCWQLQTRYMRKNSAYRMLPDIGGVLLYVNPEEKKRRHGDPIRVQKMLFDNPPVRTTRLV